MTRNAACHRRGFTLIELVVTISAIVMLSIIVVLLVNPVETTRRSRDAQRIADLGIIVASIEDFRANVPDADVRYDGDPVPNHCDGGIGNIWRWVSDSATTDSTVYGGNTTIHATESQAVDGTGWLPVNLTLLAGGPSTFRFPIDPINTVGSNPANVDLNSLMYIYACSETTTATPSFEIDANLESTRFSNTGSADKESTDGGNNPNIYEAGSLLGIMTNP